jgi:TPR repeat protein
MSRLGLHQPTELGVIYHEGDYVNEDESKAKQYYEKGAAISDFVLYRTIG